jgi:hypothetical protein
MEAYMAHTLTHRGHHVRERDDYDSTHLDDTVVHETRQRERYGGLNPGAAFFGWITATGIGVMLTGFLAAAGSAIALSNLSVPDVQGALNGETAQTVGLVSGAMLLLALFIAYYAGGYVAGRMSRFDGARQGAGVWIIGIAVTILLGALGAMLGSQYNLFQNLNLPALPVNQDSLTTGGLITSLLAVALTLLAAVMGGKVGERYHHKVDEAGAR